MSGCYSIRECYNMFSGVKLSIRSFFLSLPLHSVRRRCIVSKGCVFFYTEVKMYNFIFAMYQEQQRNDIM